MTGWRLFHLKNEMLVANFLANLIGVFGVNAMMFMASEGPSKEIWEHSVPYWIDALFTPLAFSFVCVMSLVYEMPIRRYLTALFRNESIPSDLQSRARRRLLNEPFVLIALDFSMWLLSSIVYPAMHWTYGAGHQVALSAIYHGLSTGITSGGTFVCRQFNSINFDHSDYRKCHRGLCRCVRRFGAAACGSHHQCGRIRDYRRLFNRIGQQKFSPSLWGNYTYIARGEKRPI